MNAPTARTFLDADGLTAAVEKVAADAPDLVTVSSLGSTRDGRDILCAEVAAGATGPPADRRSGVLITANLHARELAGSWVSLQLLRSVTDRYGRDPAVTRVLDEQVLYVVPRIAVDGAERVLESRNGNIRSRRVELTGRHARERNVVHPLDLNGDGHILTMRWPANDGDLTTLSNDSRLLRSREPDETDGDFYRRTIEGVVPDYDGGPVVESDARSDFNRNFPSKGWRPIDWIGHGDYPLSEPETRAVAEFLYEHSNVTALLDLHTGNPAIFHPSNAGGAAPDHPADADLVERIGRCGEELTGFPFLSSYAAARGESRDTALPGSLKDFAYDRLGIPAFVVELGMFYNYLGMETADLALPDHERERRWNLRLADWHDDHPEYGLFHDWEEHEHPQLGTVEVGGWDPVLWSNPPKAELGAVAHDITEFALAVAEWRPDVRVSALGATAVGDDLYALRAEIENRGRLSTHLTRRGCETNPRSEPEVKLSSDDELDIVTGRRLTRIDHLAPRGDRCSLEWVVQASDSSEVTVTVTSPRGIDAADSISLS